LEYRTEKSRDGTLDSAEHQKGLNTEKK